MSPQQVELLLRKQRLELRAATQRAECLAMVQEWEELAAKAQRLRNLGQDLGAAARAHAPLLGVLAGALILWRPRRMLRWISRASMLYFGLRRGQRGWSLAAALLRRAGFPLP